jgi:single-strand DNA-binding protein
MADKSTCFDITVFGAQGEDVARYRTRGRGVAIDGRLDARVADPERLQRETVQIIADTVDFLDT